MLIKLMVENLTTIATVFHKKLCGDKMTKFLNKNSCFIGENVKFGKNVVVYENNHIDGYCTIDDDCVLLPGNYIIDSNIGKQCQIHMSVIENSKISGNVKIGPFARVRPKCNIESGCKIGNFVEIKNSFIGKNTKISHLAYVGDCAIGDECNIGCGVIFANYNGKSKNPCKVGSHVFIGSNCNIIAPVNIESDCFICAGTTITKDVKKDDFVIGRARQENKPNKAHNYW